MFKEKKKKQTQRWKKWISSTGSKWLKNSHVSLHGWQHWLLFSFSVSITFYQLATLSWHNPWPDSRELPVCRYATNDLPTECRNPQAVCLPGDIHGPELAAALSCLVREIRCQQTSLAWDLPAGISSSSAAANGLHCLAGAASSGFHVEMSSDANCVVYIPVACRRMYGCPVMHCLIEKFWVHVELDV